MVQEQNVKEQEMSLWVREMSGISGIRESLDGLL
jgi:hypothetical protein